VTVVGVAARESAVAAARAFLGREPDTVEPLGGTSLGAVARVTSGGETVVVKRYDAGDFEPARLVAGLGSDCFASVLAEVPAALVLVLADAGTTTMGDALAVPGADTRALATAYAAAVSDAHRALAPLGRVPGVADPGDLVAFAGLRALTPAARALRRPSEHLLAVTGGMPVAAPRAVADAARGADRALAARWQTHAADRRWVLADTNPFNLVLGPDGRWRWVDVHPLPGLPDTNLLSLPGAAFALPWPDVAAIATDAGVLDEAGIRTLNGLYSLFTLCDTWLGHADGVRDGGAPYGMDLDAVLRFSLDLAREYLAAGVPEAHGYLPLVDLLRDGDPRA
jgi:hypothetical protein